MDSNMGLPPNKNHIGRAAQNAGAPPEWLVDAIENERNNGQSVLTNINLRLKDWTDKSALREID